MECYEKHRRSVISYWSRHLAIAPHIVEDAYQDAAVRYLETACEDDSWQWWVRNVGSVLDGYRQKSERQKRKEDGFVPCQFPLARAINFARQIEAREIIERLVERFGTEVYTIEPSHVGERQVYATSKNVHYRTTDGRPLRMRRLIEKCRREIARMENNNEY